MNTQQLKELAKLADSEVTWILLPKDLANDGWCTEVVNYISVVSPSTITALVDRIEAAERERDELRAEANRLDKESQRLSGQLGSCDRERRECIKRALTAEAELARRDAAAGEFRKLFTCSGCGAEGLDQPLESRCHCCTAGAHWVEGKLYTAAQPALLPEIVVVAKAMRDWIDAVPKDVAASLPTMPGFDRDWADETIIAAKGSAQPQKVVEFTGEAAVYEHITNGVAEYGTLPNGQKVTSQFAAGFNYRGEADKIALDAAGVKWEVKK